MGERICGTTEKLVQAMNKYAEYYSKNFQKSVDFFDLCDYNKLNIKQKTVEQE